MMNRPHFRRHPRPVDPNPEYSRLDRLDGLHTRIDRLDRLDRLRTRYDAEWPSVLAAEAPGGDLAAMAAPADWGEGYEIGPWPDARDRAAKYAAWYVLGMSSPEPAWSDLPMVRAAATAYDLGLPVPLRSDPPLYRQALAGHVQVTP